MPDDEENVSVEIGFAAGEHRRTARGGRR